VQIINGCGELGAVEKAESAVNPLLFFHDLSLLYHVIPLFLTPNLIITHSPPFSRDFFPFSRASKFHYSMPSLHHSHLLSITHSLTHSLLTPIQLSPFSSFFNLIHTLFFLFYHQYLIPQSLIFLDDNDHLVPSVYSHIC